MMDKIDLRENEFLERFVGQDHVDSNDAQFWYHLLSRSFNFMRVDDPRVVDKTLDPYLVRLTLNNPQSLNIGSLVRVFIDRASNIKSPNNQATNPYYVFQTFNALYLLRTIFKSYIETLGEENLIKAFRAKLDPTPQVDASMKMPPDSPPSFINTHHSQQQQQNVQSQNIPSTLGESSSSGNQPTLVSSEEVTSGQQHAVPQPSDNQAQEAICVNDPHDSNQSNSNQNISDKAPSNALNDFSNASLPNVPVSKQDITPGAIMLDQFISTLIATIVDIPLEDSTYLLQVESINALLVLLSIQMYTNSNANQISIYKSLMHKRCSIHALVLTKTLLNNFVNQRPQPQESSSIIIGLASGLWKVLTLGYGSSVEENNDDMPPLAHQSLMLLNILTNHCTSGNKNPYREALTSCQDSRFNLTDPEQSFTNADNDVMATAATSKSALIANSIKIDFQKLFDTICAHLDSDQVALLLYMLLQSNKIFRPYILTTASNQLDKLLLPLLKILYSSIERGSHHVYMVLIIFVILSEETLFNQAIQKITLTNILWYNDRIFSEISLASFTALIIIRSFQYNTFRTKDKFLHTNLFATLANLSNHFQRLHPYVCQRLLEFLERLGKRYAAITRPEDDRSKVSGLPGSTLDSFTSPLARALSTDTNQEQDVQDASSIELDSSTPLNGSTNHMHANIGYPNGGAINIMIPQQQVFSQQQQTIAEQHEQSQQQRPPTIDTSASQIAASEQSSPNSSSNTNEQIKISMDEIGQDITLISEVIRMLLEVINNVLVIQLRENPDLIYTLLYKRGVFSSLLASHPSFYNLVINVERVLTYAYNQIEAHGRSLSVVEIKELIKDICMNWRFDQERDSNSQLLFHYVEDEQPEEFFIPYIWNRVYYSSHIFWDSKRIVLFNPEEV